jgi:hypothetical protein
MKRVLAIRLTFADGLSAVTRMKMKSKAMWISYILAAIYRRRKSGGALTDGGYYFFDLDLTCEEAEFLGWRNGNQR